MLGLLPVHLVGQYLGNCTSIRKYVNYRANRCLLDVEAVNLSKLEALDLHLLDTTCNSRYMSRSMLPSMVLAKQISALNLTSLHIDERASFNDPLPVVHEIYKLRFPPTLTEVSFDHVVPCKHLFDFLEAHWASLQEVSVCLDLRGDITVAEDDFMGCMLMSAVMGFVEKGLRAPVFLFGDYRVDVAEIRELKQGLGCAGFGYQARRINGARQVTGIALAVRSVVPPLAGRSDEEIFQSIFEQCRRFHHIQELNVQISRSLQEGMGHTDKVLRVPPSLDTVLVSYFSDVA